MRVGTRRTWLNHTVKVRDHPHACGDKSTFYPSSNYSIGSSPCVWGQGFSNYQPVRCSRIIPMRVGTSRAGKVGEQYEQDHPHACGDKEVSFISSLYNRGSSPCVWGQAERRFYRILSAGIIPMRVGTRGSTLQKP